MQGLLTLDAMGDNDEATDTVEFSRPRSPPDVTGDEPVVNRAPLLTTSESDEAEVDGKMLSQCESSWL